MMELGGIRGTKDKEWVGLSSNGAALGLKHDSCNAFSKLRNALVKSLIRRLDLDLCHRELLNCPTKGQYLDPAICGFPAS